ncbi:chromosome segregation protein Csm1/Pcs1-domain-containing protein [Amylocarpus encephaloides]|uniref:Chromosome segregation protein Csm1/Pcs1-domain-containing protein n=1 Tax=Amylocarpus encephaloides TaxID=45428 RepID=A0A9P7YDQ0_9HELO|nr:chromosome segregation protein Csm1/Pcs1-domain-containing protein [Amylocarpus encephaloides]
MSKTKQRNVTLLGLIDSDLEDELLGRCDTKSTSRILPATEQTIKKGRGRPKIAPMKVTKSQASARRSSGRLEAKGKKPVARRGRRPALADKTNQQDAQETEEVDEFAKGDVVMEDVVVEESVVMAKTVEGAAGRRKAPSKSVPVVEIKKSLEKPKSRPGRKKAVSKQQLNEDPCPEKVILESQVPEIEIDASMMDIIEESVAATAHNAKAGSRYVQHSVQRRRAGSTSDTERGDPSLRRKLGDMTKKYDALHIKYQDLREIGVKEAERTYDRLKKQCEEKEKTFNKLLASMEADITTANSQAKESKALKKNVNAKSTEIVLLQAQITQLNTSLAGSKAETMALLAEKKTLSADNKSLSAKLAANRAVAVAVESATEKSRVPGSAVKANGGIRLVGSVEAAQTAAYAQLKEDLYCDLTGLIIRSVKREENEDVFDCIQTGRNGTLHFKLQVANEDNEGYEDAEFHYIPQLDPSRDKAMIELFTELSADYLVDEVSFTRDKAGAFYARVVDILTKKV